MIYTLSIDWLSVHCHHQPQTMPECKDHSGKSAAEVQWEPISGEGGDAFGAYPWRYKLAEYGTRQFAHLHLVSMPNEEGGWDDFAEVQSVPHSGILNHNSVIIRFVNRALYRSDFWQLAHRFLGDNNFVFKGISRIDLCADFNQFLTLTPQDLIEGFAAKQLRHIGQGVGALYFNHGILRDEFTKAKEYGVQYTGLSFGVHSSDFRVYLYNKSFELLTQGDKPWIRDRWSHVGLDVRHVWRLEISIKSKGTSFKDAASGKMVTINTELAEDDDALAKVYHTLIAKKFDFRIVDKKEKNVSRLQRIRLFDEHPVYDHRTIRNVSPGNRFEKMFIKALYQLGDLYRGGDIKDDALMAQSLSYDIASRTDLTEWLAEKIQTWERPTHK